MTRCILPQSRHLLNVDVPDALLGEIVAPAQTNAPLDPVRCLRTALANPIGSPSLAGLVRSTDRVAIIVDDITRPTPADLILPPILEMLAGSGVSRERIDIVLALGTHRPMTPAEIDGKLGRAVARTYRIVNEPAGNRAEFCFQGNTARGVPVWVNRTVTRADVRIGIGMIVPHLDAGYGGGAKIILPGVCGEETVDAFHCRMADIETNLLGMENADLRLDLERFVSECVRLHFIVNVILDSRGSMYRCVAGDAVMAHRAGACHAREVYGVPVGRRYPLVIANAYPHARDLWQCTKAVAAGERLTLTGGNLILVADCPEGLGPHPRFADYIGMDLNELHERLHRESVADRCAAAEAMALCRLKQRIRIGMVSDGLSAQMKRRMGFDHYPTVEAAIAQIGDRDRAVAILTHGGTTLPLPADESNGSAGQPDG